MLYLLFLRSLKNVFLSLLHLQLKLQTRMQLNFLLLRLGSEGVLAFLQLSSSALSLTQFLEKRHVRKSY